MLPILWILAAFTLAVVRAQGSPEPYFHLPTGLVDDESDESSYQLPHDLIQAIDYCSTFDQHYLQRSEGQGVSLPLGQQESSNSGSSSHDVASSSSSNCISAHKGSSRSYPSLVATQVPGVVQSNRLEMQENRDQRVALLTRWFADRQHFKLFGSFGTYPLMHRFIWLRPVNSGPPQLSWSEIYLSKASRAKGLSHRSSTKWIQVPSDATKVRIFIAIQKYNYIEVGKVDYDDFVTGMTLMQELPQGYVVDEHQSDFVIWRRHHPDRGDGEDEKQNEEFKRLIRNPKNLIEMTACGDEILPSDVATSISVYSATEEVHRGANLQIYAYGLLERDGKGRGLRLYLAFS